jgi:hypothetical protein
MKKPIARDPIYRKRVFDAGIIELCVRWYITYRLSYRDLMEMMAERGVRVATLEKRPGAFPLRPAKYPGRSTLRRLWENTNRIEEGADCSALLQRLRSLVGPSTIII